MVPGDLVVCYPEHGVTVGGIFDQFHRGTLNNMIDDDSRLAMVVHVDEITWGVNRAMFVTTGTAVGWTWCCNWEKIRL